MGVNSVNPEVKHMQVKEGNADLKLYSEINKQIHLLLGNVCWQRINKQQWSPDSSQTICVYEGLTENLKAATALIT